MARRFSWLILLVGLICWQPQSIQAWSGGTASFTNGPYDWINSTFYFNVTGAPPNVCGTLHTYRNGSQLDSPNWICTNSSGSSSMGPYSGSSNQTDDNINIEWPDGSRTTGGTHHISDASAPTISISTYTGGTFSGGASDVQWGTGFDFGPAGWSSITTTYQDLNTSKFYGSGGYNYNTEVDWGASPSTYYGFSFNWSITPPPSSAHDPTHSYRWCAWTNDLFYKSNIACVGFTGAP